MFHIVVAVVVVVLLTRVHTQFKSNFVMGRGEKKDRAFLIDFGLARKYRLPNGELRPPRKTAGFRGTARYASINSHKMKELGRRDDMWSLFYVLVEFCVGVLPWRRIKEKEVIGNLKQKLTNAELVSTLPPQFLSFMAHLNSLGYADEPDYNHLKRLLREICRENQYPDMEGNVHVEWDWEMQQGPHSPPNRNLQPSASMEDTANAHMSVTRNSTKLVTNPMMTNNSNRDHQYHPDEFHMIDHDCAPLKKSETDQRDRGKNYLVNAQLQEQHALKPGCMCTVM